MYCKRIYVHPMVVKLASPISSSQSHLLCGQYFARFISLNYWLKLLLFQVCPKFNKTNYRILEDYSEYGYHC